MVRRVSWGAGWGSGRGGGGSWSAGGGSGRGGRGGSSSSPWWRAGAGGVREGAWLKQGCHESPQNVKKVTNKTSKKAPFTKSTAFSQDRPVGTTEFGNHVHKKGVWTGEKGANFGKTCPGKISVVRGRRRKCGHKYCGGGVTGDCGGVYGGKTACCKCYDFVSPLVDDDFVPAFCGEGGHSKACCKCNDMVTTGRAPPAAVPGSKAL